MGRPSCPCPGRGAGRCRGLTLIHFIRKLAMTRFAAAIFDLDGTLLDTERLVIDAGLEVLSSLGHAVSRGFMISLVGIDAAEGHRRLCAHVGSAIDPEGLDVAWSAATRRYYAGGIPLMAGVEVLLGDLAARALPFAVATNSATANARRKLAEAGLAHRFAEAHVVGFDAVALPKPAPDVFLAAAARLGVEARHCVAFEDSDTGVAAALAAGMTVVQVPDMLPASGRDAHHLAASILEGARACGLIK